MTRPSSPLAELGSVRVGSLNPPKLAAVREALGAFAADFEVEGVAVESGVPDQPVGFAEIVTGARSRALAARESGPCDMAVGYEDGLVEIPGADGAWFNLGCAAVTDGGRTSLGLSSGFTYPPACADRAVQERAPIGELFDALWAAVPSSEPVAAPSALSVGNVGKLSLGVLTRTEYTRHAVLCALIRFLHPGLYPDAGAAH